MRITFDPVKVPDDPNVTIWRYLDVTKFLAMLNDSALYFCRADKFNDSWEGAVTKADVEARDNLRVELAKQMAQSAATPAQIQQVIASIGTGGHIWREAVFINCWHCSEYESDAMWRLYGKQGLAIQSTFDKLSHAFDGTEQQIVIGMVKYIDHEAATDRLDLGNMIPRFFHKKNAFFHEQELRALLLDGSGIASGLPGKNMKIDLSRLLEKIIVSPEAQQWFIDLIKALLNKYGLGVPVERSSMGNVPTY